MSKSTILFIALLCYQNIQSQISEINGKILKTDLKILRHNLKHNHPNLFEYTSEAKFDRYFDSLQSNLSVTYSKTGAFKLIASTSEIIKDGHTIFLPNENTFKKYYNEQKLFPLDLHFSDESVTIIRDYCKFHSSELINKNIIRINGIHIETIKSNILKVLMRDGFNRTYPQWIINNFFRAYYAFCFNSVGTFRIEYLDGGVMKEIQLNITIYQSN